MLNLNSPFSSGTRDGWDFLFLEERHMIRAVHSSGKLITSGFYP